jgi:hypothetical protein
MEITGYPVQNDRVVWKNIDGEVVIVEPESSHIRILNGTASLIWTLADGTRQTKDFVPVICGEFDVTPEEARADVMEFCQELLQAGLINMNKGRVL